MDLRCPFDLASPCGEMPLYLRRESGRDADDLPYSSLWSTLPAAPICRFLNFRHKWDSDCGLASPDSDFGGNLAAGDNTPHSCCRALSIRRSVRRDPACINRHSCLAYPISHLHPDDCPGNIGSILQPTGFTSELAFDFAGPAQHMACRLAQVSAVSARGKSIDCTDSRSSLRCSDARSSD